MASKIPCIIGFWVLIAVCFVGSALADLDADQKACSNQLTSLSTCFAYVQGTDKSPSTECCTNLKTVRQTAPKCLCILVKDSTSPSLGFSINQTLALELPSACKVNADITRCPALLNIPANSPDAKIFGAANSSPPALPSGGSPSALTANNPGKSKSMSLSLKPQPSLSALAVLLPLGFSILSKF